MNTFNLELELAHFTSSHFKYSIRVQSSDLDSLEHVNNIVYLKWFLDGAQKHSDALGYTIEKYMSIGGAFFVKKHQIEYIKPSLLGDDLCLATYHGEVKGTSAIRHYRLYRMLPQPGLIAFGETMWVFVDLKSGRPARIPSELLQTFSDTRIQNTP